MSKRVLLSVVGLGLAMLSSACDDRSRRTTRKVAEEYAVVQGSPTAETGTPGVLKDGRRYTENFKVNVPRQCDLFQQLSVRKVDILWVVDSSGSMASKQQRLVANFNGFISQLVAADPPIDFHIAMTTTDTDSASTRGKLLSWNVGQKSGSYISCVPNPAGGSNCNTHPSGGVGTTEAVSAFTQLVQKVGTQGSAHERGLYSAYLALTNPENISTTGNARFIRPEAALYIVVVSDEDDASCHPMGVQATCTADPGCRCAPTSVLEANGGFGSVDYFVRFLESYKGYGNQDSVALAAIVALNDGPDAGVPSQFGDPNPHVGCTAVMSDGGVDIAYHGSRYIQVASQTGGVAVSICDEDFSGALNSLGYAASGLRKDYRLTRGPDLKLTGTDATGLEVFVSPPTAANCVVDGNCPSGQFCPSGRCARKVQVSTNLSPNGAQYIRCEGTTLRNVVRFDGAAVPESLSAVEVCYDVEANFRTTCP